MREGYRNELKATKADVVETGRLVIEMTRDAVTSLVEGDVDLAERVIASDDAIDSRCLALEERALEIIATQFPVARDLRLLYSLAHISMHMERMGDLGVNIAKAARRTAARRGTPYSLRSHPCTGQPRPSRARGHARRVRDQRSRARLQAQGDGRADRTISSTQFFRELSRLQDEDDIEWASSMVLASRYLERIADHAVDIGERLVYMVTGAFEAFDETNEGQEP